MTFLKVSTIQKGFSSLVGLDRDRAAKVRLEGAEASWANGAIVAHRRQLRWALLLECLELISSQLGHVAFNDKLAVKRVVALEVALREVSAEFRWNDELAEVGANNGVFLVLDFFLSLNGDAVILDAEVNLDLFWLEALDVEAQVEHARAINWADVDRVHEGEEFSHRGWAERSITNARFPLVPAAEVLRGIPWSHGRREVAAKVVWEVAAKVVWEVASKGGWEVASKGGWEVASKGGWEVASKGGWEVAAKVVREVAAKCVRKVAAKVVREITLKVVWKVSAKGVHWPVHHWIHGRWKVPRVGVEAWVGASGKGRGGHFD